MNTCYHKHTNENVSEYTHTPIMFPTRTLRASDRARAVAKQNFSRLARLFALLAALFSGISFRRAVRIITVTVCFFAFLGVIGGVEAGVLSLGIGILICAFLLFLEILCLRSPL